MAASLALNSGKALQDVFAAGLQVRLKRQDVDRACSMRLFHALPAGE